MTSHQFPFQHKILTSASCWLQLMRKFAKTCNIWLSFGPGIALSSKKISLISNIDLHTILQSSAMLKYIGFMQSNQQFIIKIKIKTKTVYMEVIKSIRCLLNFVNFTKLNSTTSGLLTVTHKILKKNIWY